jgi:betaine reductase
VVILGSPDPDSTEIYAETVTTGDPTYAGPLTESNLGLPVFHVVEPEVKSVANPDVYRDQVELMEGVLESEAIVAAVKRIREGSSA